MRKILLGVAAALCMGLSANAQFMTEDFSGATIPTMPTGWGAVYTATNMATTNGWVTTSAATDFYFMTVPNTGVHSKYAVVDEFGKPGNTLAVMTSDVFSLAGSTNAYLGYDKVYMQAVYNVSPWPHEQAWVEFTTDGSSWSLLDSIPANTYATWETRYVALPSTASTTCQVRFCYKDQGGDMIGVAVDEVKVVDILNPYAAVTGIDYNSIRTGISGDGQIVSFAMENRGMTLNSFDAYYSVNGVVIGSQTFTPSPAMNPYTSNVYSFTAPIAGSVAGTNNIKVGISAVNGTPNTFLTTADSFMTSSYVKASAQVQRAGVIEEFSSSTCPPCKSFNAGYDPLLSSLNVNQVATNVNVVKYQMNWPGLGNDRSYNGDGSTRRGYYGVNSIPEHFVNGFSSSLSGSAPFTTTQTTNFTNEFNGSKAKKAFMDMSVTYKIDTVKKKLYVTTTVTPRFTKTGNYRVLIACMDKFYTNSTNTTGQTDYYHIMRKMLPSGSGHTVSSWTDGTAQTFTDTGVVYTNGNYTLGSGSYPVQNSNTFWSNPIAGELVAFVQDADSDEMLQSIFALPSLVPVNVSTLSKVDAIALYPNPTNNAATLNFNLQEGGATQVYIADVAGRIVKTVVNKEMSVGMQSVNISTEGMATGEYIVIIATAGGNNVTRLTVSK